MRLVNGFLRHVQSEVVPSGFTSNVIVCAAVVNVPLARMCKTCLPAASPDGKMNLETPVLTPSVISDVGDV